MILNLNSIVTSSMYVVALYRYAIKGLSGDELPNIPLIRSGETFPDDRRFALIKGASKESFDPEQPKWIHKENFLCAFTAPALMATFDSEYRIMGSSQNDNNNNNNNNNNQGKKRRIRRQLTVWKRNSNSERRDRPLLGPIDLSDPTDGVEASLFFSSACGEPVRLVGVGTDIPKEDPKDTDTATNSDTDADTDIDIDIDTHVHQFGNTRSGVRERNDTRTLHVVNAATVRQFSKTIGVSLSPQRFRPNVVVDGLEPWAEFDAVGKSITVGESGTWNKEKNQNGLVLDVISRTVRCRGVSIDPLEGEGAKNDLDVPTLLQEHFPEHGPYFGVYAVVRESGSIHIGDKWEIQHDSAA